MNQFYGAKASHLPAVQVQVAAGKIEWIAGPQIVVSLSICVNVTVRSANSIWTIQVLIKSLYLLGKWYIQ